MVKLNLYRKKKLTSKKIVQRIKEKKDLQKCITLLYVDNFNSIEKMILKLKGTRKDAEEVFQYSLSKVIWLIETNNYNKKIELSTYLYTISHVLWLNTFKKLNNYTYFSSDSFHMHYDETIIENLPFKNDDLIELRKFSKLYIQRKSSDCCENKICLNISNLLDKFLQLKFFFL